MYNPHADVEYMHHTACYLPGPEHHWVIVNQYCEVITIATTSTTNHTTEVTITLILDEYMLPLAPIVRPGGMRTALRWVCQELNNGNTWLGTRLALEREARLLDYDESALLTCGHAYDYQYCLRLLTNLPGLSESWPKR